MMTGGDKNIRTFEGLFDCEIHNLELLGSWGDGSKWPRVGDDIMIR